MGVVVPANNWAAAFCENLVNLHLANKKLLDKSAKHLTFAIIDF